MREMMHEVDIFLEKWQKDVFPGWKDEHRLIHGPERTIPGDIVVSSMLGLCSNKPNEFGPPIDIKPIHPFAQANDLADLLAYRDLTIAEPVISEQPFQLLEATAVFSANVSSVPAPLPLLGAAAMLQASSRLKKCVRLAQAASEICQSRFSPSPESNDGRTSRPIPALEDCETSQSHSGSHAL
ncbi:MAG: hypothetical protein VKO39_05465 [Cyanobacteriota bacterium]|nr:hypothetical protein [Cyanobacteriota bacterium]